MKRDINKLLEEYKRLEEQRKGIMYYEDVTQIHNLSDGSITDCIVKAYQVGVAVGVRIGKREASKNKKN